ncbi:hypothetical protein K7432_005816 [Basidiobolus ranarum]|uniref:Uncharacterized protein n=1 Tax=Basidiobolus ranarum TaxID=34480 RepID=A0ABR2W2M6_9FUNG
MCSTDLKLENSHGHNKSKRIQRRALIADSTSSVFCRTKPSNYSSLSLEKKMDIVNAEVLVGSFEGIKSTKTAVKEDYFGQELRKDIGIMKEDFLGFREHITSMWSHLEGLQEQTTQAQKEINHNELCLENLEAELRFTTEAVFHVKEELDYLVNCQDYSQESLKESLRIVQYEIIKLCDEHYKTHDQILAYQTKFSQYENSAEHWFDESRRYIQVTQLSIRTLTELRLDQDIRKNTNCNHHDVKPRFNLPSPINTTNLPPPKGTLMSPLEGLLRYYLDATRGLIDIVKLSSYTKLKEEIGVLHSCSLYR